MDFSVEFFYSSFCVCCSVLFKHKALAFKTTPSIFPVIFNVSLIVISISRDFLISQGKANTVLLLFEIVFNSSKAE